MKHRIAFTALLLLLFACKPMQDKHVSTEMTDVEPTVIEKSTQVAVVVSPDRIPQGETAEQVLLTKGLEKGMANIINQILNEKPLVQVSSRAVYDPMENFTVQKGLLSATEDPITGDFSHRFDLSARFVPAKQVMGTVVDLDDTRAVAAQNEYVTLNLNTSEYLQKDVFFLVAKPKVLRSGVYQEVIGSGKIIYTLGDLAQAILMETVREIEIGDPVFLMHVQIDPLIMEEEMVPLIIEENDTSGAFVVQPVQEPEAPEEPTESK